MGAEMNLDRVWTIEVVEEWICIAVQVERVMPSVYPKMATPRIVHVRTWLEALWDELRDDDDKPKPQFQPTNKQVSMWEEVILRWLLLVDSGKDKKILWWRACGMSWNKIGRLLELERHTIANRHRRALEDLVKALNRKK
jgi:hypothetical protein